MYKINNDNGKTKKIQQNIITTISLSFFIILFSIVIFYTLTEPTNAFAIEQYSFINKWSSHGDNDGQFEEPTGIVLDSLKK